MRHINRRVVTSLICAALLMLSAASPALAQNPSVREIQPSAEAMTADVVLLRPVGIIGMAIGAAVYVVSLPFAWLGDNMDEAADELIVKPAKYTFSRPLGNI
jgi:hypothetical protein